MARPSSSTIEQIVADDQKLTGFSDESLPEGIIEVGSITDGLVTAISQDKIPRGSASVLLNGRQTPGWTESRPGTTLLTPEKPDSNKVYKLVLCLNEDGTPVVVRFALGSIFILLNNEWVEVIDFISLTPYEATENADSWWLFTEGITTGDTFTKFPPTMNQLLSGEAALNAPQVIAKNFEDWLLIVPPIYIDKPTLNITQMFDYLFVTDLLGPIGFISLDAEAHNGIEIAGRILGASAARYITTFGDRVVVAHVQDGGEIFPGRVQWCDNSNPFIWNGETSGREELIQGAYGFGDHITGLVTIGNVCYIIRRQSIWTITRQAFGTAPFRFDPYLAGFGTDLPYSLAEIQNGCIWADRRTKGIYMFIPGSLPTRISVVIDDLLLVDLEDPIWVEGSYDPFRREYTLGITTSGTDYLIQKKYLYSVDYKTWNIDDSPVVSCMGKMAGTLDVQDRLIFHSSMFSGIETGEIVFFDEDEEHDWDDEEFEFTFVSPNLGSLSLRRTIQDTLAKLKILSGGEVTFDLSNDGEDWRNEISETVTADTKLVQMGLKRQKITGDNLFWRLRSTAKTQLRSWFVRLLDKGLIR